jgi:hypothetical protein
MAARVAWVLNLDADLELASAALGPGGGYTPPRRVLEATRENAARVAPFLLGPDDVLVDEASAPDAARGLPGRAFCPTPRAIALLRAAGAEPEPHPPLEVLRRVSSRAFSAALGETLPGAEHVTDLARARALLERPPPAEIGVRWRVKRSFGMAGRGQRVLAPGPLAEPDLAFLGKAIRGGGVQIEPDVAIVAERAIHGHLDEAGSPRLGAVVAQLCDARGAWVATEPLGLRTPDDDALEPRLREEAARVATALAAAGYFGPFGIDAYVYRGVDGRPRLQPRSEVNPRYTMGFAVGFGDVPR